MKVGGRNILQSGSIVTQYGDDTFELEQSGLVFKFQFVPGDKDDVVGTVQGNILSFRMSGFTNVLGTAYTSEVGRTENRPLFLAMYVHAVGEGDKINRLVHFTFSLG